MAAAGFSVPMKRSISEDPAGYNAARRSGSTEGSRPPSDDGSVHGHSDKDKGIDIGVDRIYHELKQHQQYGGTPVGHIILRPGEDLATVLWGFVLLIGACVFFVSSMYALLVSKMMPDTGNVFIDTIKADNYVRRVARHLACAVYSPLFTQPPPQAAIDTDTACCTATCVDTHACLMCAVRCFCRIYCRQSLRVVSGSTAIWCRSRYP